MDVLNKDQIDAFWKDGYLFLEDAVRPEKLAALANEFDGWVDQSRSHSEAFGTTLDGRPRFDVEPGHTAEAPALRRIASPTELSDNYLDVMRSSIAVDAVAQLIGPNVTLNHSKVNSKLPGAGTEVRFHQDFLFEPHSNDDMITVLYFIDEVTMQNGPLEVLPGSHRGPLYEHWHDGVFTGSVASAVVDETRAGMVPCPGPSGSACLMHGRTLHGSAPNLSDRPRTLFICAYKAEDCRPLQVCHVPSIHEGELVRGKATNRVRCSESDMEYPEVPTGASFFNQQERHTVDM
ncbi:MAG: phytanoyl-CoA dioxygenase family protein [Acidimicrobiales bacterium]|jgi:phytanoyl-CoA hydroxylase|nr:phytanoyl-CoA dioxygenase family protein [Acidimicrobiales bacterium]|tara:strand:- start:8518 stop:9390 length:873 start_codon:yes stop_codon:yes gene_type:complete